MKKEIKVPLLLQEKKAKEINNQLIAKNGCFAFIGIREKIIDIYPDTYKHAYENFVRHLYILYHDYGMYFIRCFDSESVNILGNYSYILHYSFVSNARALNCHARTIKNEERVFINLKNYFFKNDPSFLDKYNSWGDFTQNASEEEWENIVKKIVSDSNKFYYFLENVSERKPDMASLCCQIKTDYQNGYYTDRSNQIEMYQKSFDTRFLKNICIRLEETDWEDDEERAKRILKKIWTPAYSTSDNKSVLNQQNIVENITEHLKEYLSCEKSDTDSPVDHSDVLLKIILQIIEKNVRNLINKEKYVESTVDILE